MAGYHFFSCQRQRPRVNDQRGDQLLFGRQGRIGVEQGGCELVQGVSGGGESVDQPLLPPEKRSKASADQRSLAAPRSTDEREEVALLQTTD